MCRLPPVNPKPPGIIERVQSISLWDKFQIGSLALIVAVLFIRAVILGPYEWVTGEERPLVKPDTLDAAAIFQQALDSLFVEYDPEVLANINPDSSGAIAWVDSMMGVLTMEEMIGQLFITNLSSRTSDQARRNAIEAVRENKVGGFLVSRAMPPQDVYEMTALLQEESNVPLFFAADYERGVGRFSNNLTEWPSNMGLGATRDPLFAAAAGRLTAIEGRASRGQYGLCSCGRRQQ